MTRINGNYDLQAWDGWIYDSNVWTPVTTTTFTIPANYTAVLNVGDKILMTQSTAKYFYVTAVSFGAGVTTVTVTGGSDYSINTGLGIQSPAFSKMATPNGFPTSFNYTPTYTGFSANPTNVVARFRVVERICMVTIVSANGTSNATTFTITLPITAATVTNGGWKSWAYTVDNGAAGTGSDYFTVSSAATVVQLIHNDNNAGWTASGSKRTEGSFWYEI